MSPKPSHNSRPSHKELTGKIRDAIIALAASEFAPANPAKLGSEFYELGLFSFDEQKDAVRAALSEVKSSHYSGAHPPTLSIEATTLNREMFSFTWQSEYFQRKMYLKFCLVGSDEFEGLDLYVHSLHQDRPKAHGRKRR